MRRPVKLGGLLLAVGAGVAAVVWALRDRLLTPGATPVTQSDAPAFRVAPPAPPESEHGDDLTAIKGVGPVFAARLTASGITRYGDVTAAGAKALSEAAEVSEDKASDWIEQARRLGG